jgi:hypothetical protein
MSEAYIWNISDHPATDVKPMVVMVLGKNIAPGRCLKVSAEDLAVAKKVQKLAGDKVVHIGKDLPADYISAKKGTKATLSKGIARAHGEMPTEAIAEDAPKAIEDVKVVETETETDSEGSYKRNKKRF